jgi:uncharacterized membrane protein YbhN (UPF0104 family)
VSEPGRAAPAPGAARRSEAETSASGPGRRSTVVWLSVGVLVSALAAWLALRGVDYAAVGRALGEAEPAAAVGGALILLASFPLLGLRWRVVARSRGVPSRRDMVELFMIGTAANNAFPGRVGEIVRGAGLSRSARRPFMESLGTVLVDRVADLVFLSLALLATLWVAPTPAWLRTVAIAGVAVTALAVLVVAGVAWWAHRRGRGLGPGRLRGLVDAFVAGLTCIRSPWTVASAAALTVAAWSAWVIGADLMFESLGIHVSIAGVFFVCAVVGLGSAIPSAPGFIGTYHWLLTAALTLQGVDKSSALAGSVLVHAAWFVPTTLIGVALALRRGIRPSTWRRASVSPAVDAVG